MSPSFAGIALKVVSTLFFTLMAASVKWLGQGTVDGIRFPVGQIMFARSFFAFIPIVIWIVWSTPLNQAIRTANPIGHLRRSIFGCGGMVFGFTGLMLLPLADATTIGYAAPLFTVALAALLLREKVRIYRWSAVLVGFGGVLLAMWPHLGQGAGVSAQGAICAFIGAICAALAMTEVRRLTATENSTAIVFYFSLASTLLGLSSLAVGWMFPSQSWSWPTASEWLPFVLVGVFGGVGQIMLTSAYRLAPTSLVAPFEYLSLLWAMTIGIFLFSERPSEFLVAGASVVVLAGLFVIWREAKLGLERKRALEAGSTRPV